MLKLDLSPENVMLGINNRDLQTFKVDLQNNQRIMDSSAGQEVKSIYNLVHTDMSWRLCSRAEHLHSHIFAKQHSQACH